MLILNLNKKSIEIVCTLWKRILTKRGKKNFYSGHAYSVLGMEFWFSSITISSFLHFLSIKSAYFMGT